MPQLPDWLTNSIAGGVLPGSTAAPQTPAPQPAGPQPNDMQELIKGILQMLMGGQQGGMGAGRPPETGRGLNPQQP